MLDDIKANIRFHFHNQLMHDSYATTFQRISSMYLKNFHKKFLWNNLFLYICTIIIVQYSYSII